MNEHSVTNISFVLLVLLNTLQLATGATGLFSQGATVVVLGCSTHALGPILGEFTLSAGGEAHDVHQALPWNCWNRVPLWSTFAGKTQTSSLSV